MKKVVYLFFALFLVISMQGVGQGSANVIEQIPDYCLGVDDGTASSVFLEANYQAEVELFITFACPAYGTIRYNLLEGFVSTIEALVNRQAEILKSRYLFHQGSSHRIVQHKYLAYV